MQKKNTMIGNQKIINQKHKIINEMLNWVLGYSVIGYSVIRLLSYWLWIEKF